MKLNRFMGKPIDYWVTLQAMVESYGLTNVYEKVAQLEADNTACNYNFSLEVNARRQLEAELKTYRERHRDAKSNFAAIQRLREENKWMRREVERVGHALYTGTITGYVGTEEDLQCIGQDVEGVCETNEKMQTMLNGYRMAAELEAKYWKWMLQQNGI